MLKYIDNNILHEKLCMDGLIIDEFGRKKAHALRTQNLCKRIVRIAESMGMKVNLAKTMLLCISDSRTYEAATFIEDLEGNEIESQSSMKFLGVHLSNKPNMATQVSC